MPGDCGRPHLVELSRNEIFTIFDLFMDSLYLLPGVDSEFYHISSGTSKDQGFFLLAGITVGRCGFQQLPDTKLSLHALGCPVWASLAWICLCVFGLHVFLSFALLSLGLPGMCERVVPSASSF